jgi:hypothetical protein
MVNNKKRHTPGQRSEMNPSVDSSDKPVTLKDLLGAETIAKLKQQADAMKQEEANKAEKKRLEAEAARLAEQKRNENDFEYLLNHSNPKSGKYI